MFMYVYGDVEGLYTTSRFYFLIYIFLSSYVMLNMFQLVVMQQFEEYYINEDNALNSFDTSKEPFKITWNLFTIKEEGQKIKSSKLVSFFKILA